MQTTKGPRRDSVAKTGFCVEMTSWSASRFQSQSHSLQKANGRVLLNTLRSNVFAADLQLVEVMLTFKQRLVICPVPREKDNTAITCSNS